MDWSKATIEFDPANKDAPWSLVAPRTTLNYISREDAEKAQKVLSQTAEELPPVWPLASRMSLLHDRTSAQEGTLNRRMSGRIKRA